MGLLEASSVLAREFVRQRERGTVNRLRACFRP
jgi:hypothetical protein